MDATEIAPYVLAALFCILGLAVNFYYFSLRLPKLFKARIQLPRLIQIISHVTSIGMVLFKLLDMVMMVVSGKSLVVFASLASVFSFFYYWTACVYYLEILKPLHVILNRFWLRGKWPMYWQIIVSVLNVACNGSTLFRYTVYENYASNNWASKWSSANVLIIVLTAVLGVAIAITVFRTVVNAKVPTTTTSITESVAVDDGSKLNAKSREFDIVQRADVRKIHRMLISFGVIQLVLFSVYSMNGALLSNKNSKMYGLAYPLAVCATGIDAINNGIFTYCFEKIIAHFLRNKNSSNRTRTKE